MAPSDEKSPLKDASALMIVSLGKLLRGASRGIDAVGREETASRGVSMRETGGSRSVRSIAGTRRVAGSTGGGTAATTGIRPEPVSVRDVARGVDASTGEEILSGPRSAT